MKPALVVVNGECLARRSTNEAVEFPFAHAGSSEKSCRGDLLNGLAEKLRAIVRPRVSLGRMRIEVNAGHDAETRLPESFRQSTCAAEKVYEFAIWQNGLQGPPRGSI